MSVDLVLHGVPERIPESHVAAMLVQWCGTAIATLHTEPALHVALRGESLCDPEHRRGPRVVEVYRRSPRVLLLTMRLADGFTTAVAEGFAVWWLRQFGRKDARAEWSGTGRVVWTREMDHG